MSGTTVKVKQRVSAEMAPRQRALITFRWALIIQRTQYYASGCITVISTPRTRHSIGAFKTEADAN